MPWDTDDSSGLLGHFTGTITDSWFSTDADYQDGKTVCLWWTVEVEEVLQEDYEGQVPEEVTNMLSIGSDWLTEDRETVTHKKGRSKFHSTSVYGKLLNIVLGKAEGYSQYNQGRLIEAELTDGGDDVDIDFGNLESVLQKRGDPEQAKIWNGLRFEFRGMRFNYGKGRDGNLMMSGSKPMPARFLGVVEDAKLEPAKAASKATKATKATAKAAPAPVAEERPDLGTALTTVNATEAQTAFLNGALAEADSFAALSKAAFAIDGVSENSDLLAFVLDQNAGLWTYK